MANLPESVREILFMAFMWLVYALPVLAIGVGWWFVKYLRGRDELDTKKAAEGFFYLIVAPIAMIILIYLAAKSCR